MSFFPPTNIFDLLYPNVLIVEIQQCTKQKSAFENLHAIRGDRQCEN